MLVCRDTGDGGGRQSQRAEREGLQHCGERSTGRGLTWAGATAAGASPSLSDSSLLLSESSGLPALAWTAAGPALPGGAGMTPFLGDSLAGAETALTWVGFPEDFA